MGQYARRLLQSTRKYCWPISSALLLAVAIVLFVGTGYPQIWIIISALFLFVILLILTDNLYTALLVVWLLLGPFNITYQLDFLSQFYDPYVQNIKVNYLVPTLSIVDILLFLSLISIWMQNPFILRERRFVYFSLFLLAVVAIHIMFHMEVNVVITALRFVGFLLLALTVSHLTLKNIIKISLKNILYIVSLSLFAQLIIGICQFLSGASLGLDFLGESRLVGGMLNSSFITFDGSVLLRAYGTFPHPNVLAGFSLLSSVFLQRLLAKDLLVEHFGKAIAYLSLLVSTLLIALTFSRSALLVQSFVLLSFVVPKYFKDYLALKTVAFRNSLKSKFGGYLLMTNSVIERVSLIKIGMPLIFENCFKGVGAGESVKYIGKSTISTSSGIPLLQPIHNIFMHFSLEWGMLLGVPFSLFIVYYVIKRGWFLIVMFIIVEGMLDHYLVSLPQGLMILMLWFILVEALGYHEDRT